MFYDAVWSKISQEQAIMFEKAEKAWVNTFCEQPVKQLNLVFV